MRAVDKSTPARAGFATALRNSLRIYIRNWKEIDETIIIMELDMDVRKTNK